MRKSRGATALLAAGIIAGTVVAGNSAGAAGVPFFSAYASGAYVQLLNQTVTSELASPSSICCGGALSDTGSTAGASIRGILTVRGVTTSTTSKAITGGYEIVATAKLAGVSLLSGAIRIDALTTTNDVILKNGVATATPHSEFVGLHVAGHSLPKIIPDNFGLSLPGLATVVLNFSQQASGNGLTYIQGSGIAINLLKPRGDAPAGATVLVGQSLVWAGQVQPTQTGHGVAGDAYGTSVKAAVGGNLVNVNSDPTDEIKMGLGGTAGATNSRSVAAVKLNTAAKVGAVTNSVEGVNTTTEWEAHTTSRVAAVNLFNGLIRADAVTADARSAGGTAPHPGITGSSEVVNLHIAGKAIPVDASPNTVINVLNLGKVTLNQQIRTSNGITVRALDIVLSTARYGLPAGAEVQVAVAYAAAA
jgi:hypothetical protein